MCVHPATTAMCMKEEVRKNWGEFRLPYPEPLFFAPAVMFTPRALLKALKPLEVSEGRGIHSRANDARTQ